MLYFDLQHLQLESTHVEHYDSMVFGLMLAS